MVVALPLRMTICCELQAVGTIGYWAALVQAGEVWLEKQERFQKSGYRNRYTILSAQGPLLLTIPVQGTRDTRLTVDAVQIDNSRPWQVQHWRGLVSCYSKSPFFSLLSHRIEKLYAQPYTSLWHWNLAMHETIKQLLKLAIPTQTTNAFRWPLADGVQDYRGIEKPGTRLHTGAGFPPYTQVFGTHFAPNLSVLDLIFNEGQAAFGYLRSLTLGATGL